MTLSLPPRIRTALRLLLAFIGGYYLSVGLATLFGVGLALMTGGVRMDAYFAAGISSSLIFCTVLIWAFSERRLWLIAAVTVAGATLSFAAAKALEPSIHLPA